MDLKQHLLVSCAFGTGIESVYPAVSGRNCVFFSNNDSVRSEVEAKGWIFEFVNIHPRTNDLRISSMQSKYIKFLQFLRDFPEYHKFSKITYFDHKFFVQESHVTWIDNHFQGNKSILIRHTPRRKTSIFDEVKDANNQKRYSESMPATLEWIDYQKRCHNIVENTRISNTGIIAYKSIEAIKPLLDSVYNAVWQLAQPECQIIWACLSQPYSEYIQTIDWNELSPVWKTPKLE